MDVARDKGLAEIEGLVLAKNSDMLDLMKNLGFDCKRYVEDPDFNLVTHALTVCGHREQPVGHEAQTVIQRQRGDVLRAGDHADLAVRAVVQRLAHQGQGVARRLVCAA
eukprot:gene3358-4577_t